MSSGVELEDFMRNKVTVSNEDELYALYEAWERQRAERSIEKLKAFGQNVEHLDPDPYLDWLIKRGICPHALVSDNSKYHFETVVILDSDMGVRFPDPNLTMGDNPSLFFQSLNIVREQRRMVKEEANAKNNSD